MFNHAPDRSLALLIDDQPMSGLQACIVALCAVIAMLDGFDTQSIAFVAPVIALEWHLPIASFGAIFALGLVGGMVGALGFGLMADAWGRKASLIASVSVFATGSLLTGWSGSAIELAALRFLTGLGLGGAMPGIISMTAEYSPRRIRATLVTVMFCGFPLGAVMGALGATKLVPIFGWRSIFLVGGCLPVLILPALVFAMPESLRWLAARNRRSDILRVVKRLRVAHDWDETIAHNAATPLPRNKITALFGDGLGVGTTLLWLTTFMSLLLVYLLVSWVPTIAVESGRGANAGLVAAAILNVSGILGSICFGRLSDRFGASRVVGAAYVCGAVTVLAVGLATKLSGSIYWVAGLAGFFCIGAQLCVVAIASGFYSLELRATGVGTAMGVGRAGAIVGPLVGALLIRSAGSQDLLFVVLAAAALVSGMAVLGIGRAARPG